MDWKELYPKSTKPRLEQVNAYLSAAARPLFAEFNRILKEIYGLGYVLVAYSNRVGWLYRYGHSGLILLNNVCFHHGVFSVEGVDVSDRASLDLAIGRVRELHGNGFLERFEVFRQARTEKRKRRAKRFPPQDKDLNPCRWPPAVSRRDLQRLYAADAGGLPDPDLLDNIGFTLYTRCVVAREVYDLLEQGKIKCLHCGRVMDYAELMDCPCGKRYTYRGYRQSFRTNNMPRGQASPIFDKFIADWEVAGDSAIKMRLIDNLIHEFHVSDLTGTINRPVGVNLIQGTKTQIAALIEELAYGKS